MIPGAGNRQQQAPNVAPTSQKDVTSDADADADVDAESEEYVDSLERRGGPGPNRFRNRFRNRPNLVPIRPLPPDVVVPDFPSENFDIPYADLSHLVINKYCTFLMFHLPQFLSFYLPNDNYSLWSTGPKNVHRSPLEP